MGDVSISATALEFRDSVYDLLASGVSKEDLIAKIESLCETIVE